jgi:hypothetical protein
VEIAPGCHSIIEYTPDPNCILRIKLAHLDNNILLSDGTSGHAGDRIINLHLWNEKIPRLPKHGASIAWGEKMNLCLRYSLRELARYLPVQSDLDDICFERSNMAFVTVS